MKALDYKCLHFTITSYLCGIESNTSYFAYFWLPVWTSVMEILSRVNLDSRTFSILSIVLIISRTPTFSNVSFWIIVNQNWTRCGHVLSSLIKTSCGSLENTIGLVLRSVCTPLWKMWFTMFYVNGIRKMNLYSKTGAFDDDLYFSCLSCKIWKFMNQIQDSAFYSFTFI